MIELDLLRCFLAIYRTGSVTRAAHSLALSQPAVSARLKSLENRIGKPLFRREGRGLEVTREARNLARLIATHIDSLEAIFSASASGTTDLTGTVRIAGPVEFISLYLTPLMSTLIEAGVHLDIRLSDANERIDLLANGEIDLAIATNEVTDKMVDFRRLQHEKYMLVGAPRWGSSINPGLAELIEAHVTAPILAYADTLPMIRRYWTEVFGRSVQVRPALIFPDLRSLVSAAAFGAGVTVLPDYLCRSELADGRLIVLYEPSPQPGNDILLVWKKGRQHTRNLVVRDLFIKLFSGQDGFKSRT